MANENMEWINNSKVEELEKLESIDRKKAEDIVNFREKNGEFKSWEDLKRIPGFSKEMIEEIKNHNNEMEDQEDDMEEEEET